MKRLILTLAAVASVAGPTAMMATDAAAQSRDRYERRDDRRDWRDNRRDNRQDYRNDRRDDRRDYRNDRRDDRRDRWDSSRYNGYYYNNRWAYGPPPSAYYGNPGYRPGYQAWRRGGYLPPNYRGYVLRDYGRYGLRPPPRGYYWYNVNGDYLLAAITTGLIFDIITR